MNNPWVKQPYNTATKFGGDILRAFQRVYGRSMTEMFTEQESKPARIGEQLNLGLGRS